MPSTIEEPQVSPASQESQEKQVAPVQAELQKITDITRQRLNEAKASDDKVSKKMMARIAFRRPSGHDKFKVASEHAQAVLAEEVASTISILAGAAPSEAVDGYSVRFTPYSKGQNVLPEPQPESSFIVRRVTDEKSSDFGGVVFSTSTQNPDQPDQPYNRNYFLSAAGELFKEDTNMDGEISRHPVVSQHESTIAGNAMEQEYPDVDRDHLKEIDHGERSSGQQLLDQLEAVRSAVYPGGSPNDLSRISYHQVNIESAKAVPALPDPTERVW